MDRLARRGGAVRGRDGAGWPAAALALTAAGPAVATGRADRHRRLGRLTRERNAALHRVRIRQEGESARGAVVEVADLSDEPDYRGLYSARLRIRYTTAAGTDHTVRHDTDFSVHRPPRVGLGATVRFLPEDPTDTEIALDPVTAAAEAPPAPAPASAPAPVDVPAVPGLPAQLEHLHHLHLDGALTAEEFALAKRQLIAPPD
ncbi:DUF3592 domain-containing protein [Kitasatospora sp. NPDC088391]|uniref:DUF3592 domain-containing protein n=1 Tax=Kitasatospora sp. NPDC088391 TaxID=3364074 RepID=UPI00380F41B7